MAFVCYDADNHPDQPLPARRRQITDLITAAGVNFPCHPVIPVQELEAWWLADIGKLAAKYNWCRKPKQHQRPERINDPKEELRRMTRHPTTGKFHYDPPTDNPVMARLIDPEVVAKRCPAFKSFMELVLAL